MRMGRWKGIRKDVAKQPDAPIELYDFERDLAETTNEAAANPDVVRRIEALMKSSHTRAVVPRWNFTTLLKPARERGGLQEASAAARRSAGIESTALRR